MAYVKTNWVAGVTPLSEANMDHLETQYEEAVDDIKRKMIPPTARWTSPGWWWENVLQQVVTANRTYYMPIYVAETTTYIRIGMFVGVGDGAGGTADLRIFEWDNGVPGDLILSAGTVSTNAAGAKEIVIAQALSPGYYFLAVRFDQAPQGRHPSSISAVAVPTSGLSLTGNAQHNLIIMYDDAAYADPAGAVDGAVTVNFAFVVLREN